MEHAPTSSQAVRLPILADPQPSPPDAAPSASQRRLRWALLLAALLLTPGLSTLGLVMAAGGGDETRQSTPDHSARPTHTQENAALDGGMWHTVADGETLRTIARHYYGTSRLWRAVQLANDAPQHPPDGTRLWLPAIMPEL